MKQKIKETEFKKKQNTTQKEGISNSIKLIITTLSLAGGVFGFFGSYIGEMFFSSNVSWESFLFMILSVGGPFWFGGILWGVVVFILEIIKKKIDRTRLYFYCTLVYAGIMAFNTMAEITDYSRRSFLIWLGVVWVIWSSEKLIEQRKKD